MKLVSLAAVLFGLTACPSTQQSTAPEGPTASTWSADQANTINFPISCNEAAQAEFARGVGLLHHMTYWVAEKAFVAASEADPDCGMAYWGIGMTLIHPVWIDLPTPETIARGRELVAKARAGTNLTPRETAFVDALSRFFEGDDVPKPKRVAAWSEGLKVVFEQFPDDVEAKAFYALAHLSTAAKTDKSFRIQKEAAAIGREVLAVAPDHPGAHHYLIHALDHPGLASGGLDIANRYSEIAPENDHALHMPSHIFTRLGMWDKAVELNIRSAAAAKSIPSEGLSQNYFHALDYMTYAYLQSGQNEKAAEVLVTVESLIESDTQVEAAPATAVVLAAVPARYALERHQWTEARKLKARRKAGFPWDRFAAFEAITYFAHGLGAARTNDPAAAERALTKLKELRGREEVPYWQKQIDIYVRSVEAWKLFAEGKQAAAIAASADAAALEAATGRHPVVPGYVLPARELHGDLLSAAGKNKEALAAYESTLEAMPRRLNSLFGAAKAADAIGDQARASALFRELIETCRNADDGLSEVNEAQDYIRRSGS